MSTTVTKPPVLLGGSLGSTKHQWNELAEFLSPEFTAVPFDHRGHGEAPPAESGVRVEDLADDVIAMANAHHLERFHYVGISMGGAVGQQLALDHPDRLLSLTLVCTAPHFGDAASWHERAALVRRQGMGVLREGTAARWFTDEVRPSARAQGILDVLTTTDPESYAACCEALAAYDVRERLPEISIPTLVIGADGDPVSPPEVIELFTAIAQARFVTITNSRHLANINQPEAVNTAVRAFLRGG